MPESLILPRGITGFDIETAPFDETLFRRFGAACRVIARTGSGRMGTLEDCAGQVTPNFHIAELHRPTGTAYLLCNAHYPWVAATLLRPAWMGTLFVDLPEVVLSAKMLLDFTVPAARDLNRQPEPDDLGQLTGGELHEYRGWRRGGADQTRLGDLIFNFWD